MRELPQLSRELDPSGGISHLGAGGGASAHKSAGESRRVAVWVRSVAFCFPSADEFSSLQALELNWFGYLGVRLADGRR